MIFYKCYEELLTSNQAYSRNTWRCLYQPQKTWCVCVIMMEELHLMCVVKITSTSHIKGSREFCHTMPLHKSLDHILSFRCTIGWSYWNWDLLLIFWPMKVQVWSWINVRSIKKDTKRSSNTLLCLVSFFTERMLCQKNIIVNFIIQKLSSKHTSLKKI